MLPHRKGSTGQSFRLCQPIHTVKERIHNPRISKIGSQFLHYKAYAYLFLRVGYPKDIHDRCRAAF
jgi:hypothetical protein